RDHSRHPQGRPRRQCCDLHDLSGIQYCRVAVPRAVFRAGGCIPPGREALAEFPRAGPLKAGAGFFLPFFLSRTQPPTAAFQECSMYKLTVENLYKRFGDNEVLKGVSLNARAGDVVSMIGASGSGKST